MTFRGGTPRLGGWSVVRGDPRALSAGACAARGQDRAAQAVSAPEGVAVESVMTRQPVLPGVPVGPAEWPGGVSRSYAQNLRGPLLRSGSTGPEFPRSGRWTRRTTCRRRTWVLCRCGWAGRPRVRPARARRPRQVLATYFAVVGSSPGRMPRHGASLIITGEGWCVVVGCRSGVEEAGPARHAVRAVLMAGPPCPAPWGRGRLSRATPPEEAARRQPCSWASAASRGEARCWARRAAASRTRRAWARSAEARRAVTVS
ncbi:hypothetical protein M2156_005811 [Streptomyces sp. SAI-149]|nr:hypothetical protein [Streptomyces sp. SAI-119]MDH6499592.1 hypothetical protein [Streptomyces sp. SAI-149]